MKTGRAAFLGAVSILIIATCVQASRVYRPMGCYVREADLIVIGNTSMLREAGTAGRPVPARSQILLSVQQVLKGDISVAGKELVLSMSMSTADVHIPNPATNLLVLLQQGGRDRKSTNDGEWTPVEVYQSAEELAALRALIEVYRLPQERQQLLALREHALAGQELCLVQLLADLADMREPANFSIMTSVYDALAPTNQARLVEIIGRTSDPRAVPALLKAMQSPDPSVSSSAAHQLMWHYPGAPGVTEAFEQAFQQKRLSRQGARYLALRRDLPALEQIKGADTPVMRAERLWQAGKMQEARAAYLAIITDPNGHPYTRRQAALKLMPGANSAEKESIRQALLGLLAADASSGNYLELGDAAQILRELHHPDCLPALLPILPRADSLDWRAARTATMAICALGPEAQKQAVKQVVERLESSAPKIQAEDARTVHLLELIWLGDKETYDQAANALPPGWRTLSEALRPLTLVGEQQDEGAFLLQMFGQRGDLPGRAQEWIIYRLGDLKERRGVKVLAEMLRQPCSYGMSEALKDALERIGGAEVEREMLPLLAHENQTARALATEILFRIQGERSRHLARRMLEDRNYGLKQPAMLHLAQVGTPEDLPLLLPYCDYWKAERATHYWAVQAVSSIRERYHYDVNGPIVKR